jgi:hypothetical protein
VLVRYHVDVRSSLAQRPEGASSPWRTPRRKGHVLCSALFTTWPRGDRAHGRGPLERPGRRWRPPALACFGDMPVEVEGDGEGRVTQHLRLRAETLKRGLDGQTSRTPRDLRSDAVPRRQWSRCKPADTEGDRPGSGDASRWLTVRASCLKRFRLRREMLPAVSCPAASGRGLCTCRRPPDARSSAGSSRGTSGRRSWQPSAGSFRAAGPR